MNDEEPIYVVRPNLPPFEEFTAHLETIWQTRFLTNGGPLHERLESQLCEHLGVPALSLFNNATIALMTAMKVLDLKGEVITTPFSFIATAHALLWNNLTPVFVDIDPLTLNINPGKIEAAITDKTSAILAVHCYGHPCDVKAIQSIADKYGLKVIYDAAHVFGVEDDAGSILNHGDISALSFHATKVFNTFEGGALVCKDKALKKEIDQFKNFGIVDEENIAFTGLNGKMSEAHAAMGLAQLPHMQEYLSGRKKVDALYRKELEEIKSIFCLQHSGQEKSNYSYFPIILKEDYKLSRDELHQIFKTNNIYSRRYFYPLISEFLMYSGFSSSDPALHPVAKKASEQILCLPIYPDLQEEAQRKVIKIIKENA